MANFRLNMVLIHVSQILINLIMTNRILNQKQRNKSNKRAYIKYNITTVERHPLL